MKITNVIGMFSISVVLSGAVISSVWAFSGEGRTLDHSTGQHSAKVDMRPLPESRLLQSAMNQVHFAETNLQRAQQQGIQQRIGAAQILLRNSERLLTLQLSYESGIPESKIMNMRQSGLSWTEVQVELKILLANTHQTPDLGNGQPQMYSYSSSYSDTHRDSYHNNYRDRRNGIYHQDNYYHHNMMGGMH